MSSISGSLQRYYDFNGTTTDIKGGVNAVTAGPNISYPQGLVSSQSLYVGATSYCSASAYSPVEFSCAFWLYVSGSTVGNFIPLVGHMTPGSVTGDWCLLGVGLALGWYSNGNTSRIGVTSLNANAWNHVAMTRSATQIGRIFTNGVLQNTPTTVSGSALGDYLYFASRPDSFSTAGFRIQEVGLWNRKLADAEIYQLYTQQLGFNGIYSASDASIVDAFSYYGTNFSQVSATFDVPALNFTNRPIHSTDRWNRQVLYSQLFYMRDVPGTASIPVVPTGSNLPPIITNFTPTTGSDIYTTSELQFNVIDPESGSFKDIIVMTSYSSGIYEVAHDGAQFSTAYAGVSTKTPISGGFHFVLARNDGWPRSPTVKIAAFDVSGSENT